MVHVRPRSLSCATTPLLRAIASHASGKAKAATPSCLQTVQHRQLHNTRSVAGSPFFQLGALANSRETQYFSKASRLDRVEHSTNLELIRSSEVKPFERKGQQHPRTVLEQRRKKVRNQHLQQSIQDGKNRSSHASPLPSSSPSFPGEITRSQTPPSNSAASKKPSRSDTRTLSVGRLILKTHRLQTTRLRRLLRQSKNQTKAADARANEASKKLRNEMHGASTAILLTIAAATGLVSWWAWPSSGVARKPRMGPWTRGDEEAEREWPFKTRESESTREFKPPPPSLSEPSTEKCTGTVISITGPNALPQGWEKAKSVDGQVYYIDHNTRTTSWDKPTSAVPGKWNVTVTSPKKGEGQETVLVDGENRASFGEDKPGKKEWVWKWSGNMFWSS